MTKPAQPLDINAPKNLNISVNFKQLLIPRYPPTPALQMGELIYLTKHFYFEITKVLSCVDDIANVSW